MQRHDTRKYYGFFSFFLSFSIPLLVILYFSPEEKPKIENESKIENRRLETPEITRKYEVENHAFFFSSLLLPLVLNIFFFFFFLDVPLLPQAPMQLPLPNQDSNNTSRTPSGAPPQARTWFTQLPTIIFQILIPIIIQ